MWLYIYNRPTRTIRVYNGEPIIAGETDDFMVVGYKRRRKRYANTTSNFTTRTKTSKTPGEIYHVGGVINVWFSERNDKSAADILRKARANDLSSRITDLVKMQDALHEELKTLRREVPVISGEA